MHPSLSTPRFLSTLHTLRPSSPLRYLHVPSRETLSYTRFKMSDLSIELTAPNGRKYTQPTGIFIDNEWVKPKSGDKITSINPSYKLFQAFLSLSLLSPLQGRV